MNDKEKKEKIANILYTTLLLAQTTFQQMLLKSFDLIAKKDKK